MSVANTHNVNVLYALVLIAGLGVGAVSKQSPVPFVLELRPSCVLCSACPRAVSKEAAQHFSDFCVASCTFYGPQSEIPQKTSLIKAVVIPCSIIAQLCCPDDLIGTITAITLAVRYVGGAVGFSVYDNVLYHKFVLYSTDIVAKDTIIGGGLVNYTSPTDLPLVLELATLAADAQFTLLQEVIATDPRVIGHNAYELIVLATREAWSLAYRWPYWTSIAWGLACFILAFFLGDIHQFLDNHIAVKTKDNTEQSDHE